MSARDLNCPDCDHSDCESEIETLRERIAVLERQLATTHVSATDAAASCVGTITKLEQWAPVIDIAKRWHVCITGQPGHGWCACHRDRLNELATAVDRLLEQERKA